MSCFQLTCSLLLIETIFVKIIWSVGASYKIVSFITFNCIVTLLAKSN